jgi:hypothetical protein
MDSDQAEPTENPEGELDNPEVFSYNKSHFSKDDKYLNRLDLVQFNKYTQRLTALKEFTRSFVPHMSDHTKSGMDFIFGDVAKPIKDAASRALISAFNQIDRICSKDLEPINILFGEENVSDEYDPNDDYLG